MKQAKDHCQVNNKQPTVELLNVHQHMTTWPNAKVPTSSQSKSFCRITALLWFLQVEEAMRMLYITYLAGSMVL